MKNNLFKLNKLTINFFLIISLIFYDYAKNNYLYFICKNCLNENNNEQKCLHCDSDIIFQSIKYKSRDETLNELLNYNKSIARFGDGEFKIIFGKKIGFQKYNNELQKKLLIVLNSNIPNLLIGIPPLYKPNFWLNLVNRYKTKFIKLGKIMNKSKIYYSSFITRFYEPKENKTYIKEYIKKFKELWNKRNILTIEGDKTRLGFGNNLFNNAKSIQRIICPSQNAFKIYNKIFQYVTNLNIAKETLILISLGPTATILTYDIIKYGIKNQVIDFGHFDIQYEYYLRNATKKIKIPYKFVNEVRGGKKNIRTVKDLKYLSQIIHYIK